MPRSFRCVCLWSCVLWLPACGEDPQAGDASVASLRAAASGANVLLVTLDTTRADRIGCYGHARARTLLIDRMAADGIRVERALAAAPVTLPSHASILTGRNPVQHGVRDNGIFRLGSGERTLAEELKGHGYATAAFISAYPLSTSSGIDQGFDHFDDAIVVRTVGQTSQIERRAGETVDAFLGWMKSAPREPWFVWLHFFDPHSPLEPPEPFAHELADPYDGEIAYVDAELERCIAAYDQGGRLDRTLLVITADHGEGLGDHKELHHGLFVYDATMRVPLVFRFPPLGKAKRVTGQVGLVDVMPTVLDVLGIDLPPDLDGSSLLGSLIDARPQVHHDVYLETQLAWFTYGVAPLEAVSTDHWKYIEAPRPELYAWDKDPLETVNCVDRESEEARKGRELVAKLRRGREFRASQPDRALDAEERENLLKLGYLTGAPVSEEMQGADPKDAMDLMNAREQALTLLGERRFAEVEAVLRPLLEQWPNDAGMQGLLGHVLMLQKKGDEAVAVLQRCLALRPDQTGASLDLARAFRERGEPEKAIAAFEQLLRHAPTLLDAYVEASNLCRQIKDFDKALRLLEAAHTQAERSGLPVDDLDKQIEQIKKRIGSPDR